MQLYSDQTADQETRRLRYKRRRGGLQELQEKFAHGLAVRKFVAEGQHAAHDELTNA